ncbi:hypothetical protein EDC94DRAFT_648487 [Helicostylum pulchrum]|nr:hypothetical protein EDC94DRAFT_648487 [Helicostylum pulchrum]
MPNIAHGDILKLDIQFGGGYSVNAGAGAGAGAAAGTGAAVVVLVVNMTGKNDTCIYIFFTYMYERDESSASVPPRVTTALRYWGVIIEFNSQAQVCAYLSNEDFSCGMLVQTDAVRLKLEAVFFSSSGSQFSQVKFTLNPLPPISSDLDDTFHFRLLNCANLSYIRAISAEKIEVLHFIGRDRKSQGMKYITQIFDIKFLIP